MERSLLQFARVKGKRLKSLYIPGKEKFTLLDYKTFNLLWEGTFKDRNKPHLLRILKTNIWALAETHDLSSECF